MHEMRVQLALLRYQQLESRVSAKECAGWGSVFEKKQYSKFVPISRSFVQSCVSLQCRACCEQAHYFPISRELTTKVAGLGLFLLLNRGSANYSSHSRGV